jgi:hypothetical protein
MASGSVTSRRWKMMAMLTSGPKVAATQREEKGARLRPVVYWAGPLRLAAEKEASGVGLLGPRRSWANGM